jgi:sugar phosphate isomerase/epimerase
MFFLWKGDMTMKLAVNTDFQKGTGCPEESLRAAAAAGFTHLHWCHQWNTDFIYGEAEQEQIKAWLHEFGLTLLDIHGSVGPEKNWFSLLEYERLAGVEMVANRLKMHAALGGTGVVMMHAPAITARTPPGDVDVIRAQTAALRKSLHELTPLIRQTGVPIALENTPNDLFEVIAEMFDAFPPEIVGLCYDSGHGHMGEDRGLDFLEVHADRLLALHLHDNDGGNDQHQPPYMGTLDWERLANLLAGSAYRRELSFEIAMRCTPFTEAAAFLEDAFARCCRFAEQAKAAGFV